MSPLDFRQQISDSITEIESGVRDYESGQLSAYRRIATELYGLLVDTNKKSGPLLLRVFEAPRFKRQAPPTEETELGRRFRAQYPGKTFRVVSFDARGGSMRLTAGGDKSHVTFHFEPGAESVSLDEWLDDWVFNEQIRIRDLITDLRHKETAHTDSAEGITATRLGQWQAQAGGREIELKRSVIAGIGKYVAARVREMLDEGASDAPPPTEA